MLILETAIAAAQPPLNEMRKELKWDQTAVDHIVGQWYSEQAGLAQRFSGRDICFSCVLQESLHELLFVLPPAAGKLRLCTPWSSKRVRQFNPDDVGWNMLSRLPSVKAVKAELCIVSQPSLESQLVAASSLGFPSSGRDGPFIKRQILRCAEPGRESIKLPICRVKRSEIAEIAQGEGIKIL